MISEQQVKCTCSNYKDLGASRKSINRRIQDSKQLKTFLTLLSDKSDHSNKLYRCDSCGQCWQGSYALNWGGHEYLYKVPAIDLNDWRIEPFVQPDQLILYIGSMQDYHERLKPEETGSRCKADGCDKRSIKLSIYCLQHHTEQLQANGILPRRPHGRYFPPYDGSS